MSVFLIPKIYCLYVKYVEKKEEEVCAIPCFVFFFSMVNASLFYPCSPLALETQKGNIQFFPPRATFFFPVYCSLWQKMSSRRATSSSFGNGRSSNGDDISGSSRPSSCSYLSNVRPENRYRFSTNPVCSVTCQNVSVWDLVNQIHAL